MCGIVGALIGQNSKITAGRRDTILTDFLTEGLYMDALRGPHATGIFRVEHDKEKSTPNYYKRALHAFDFLNLPGTASILANPERACAIVGHNRYATQGGSSPNGNAHPFQNEHITLVHNGNISNSFDIVKYGEYVHEVDSARVAYALSKRPALEVLPKLEGAYVLVWHDASTGKLCIATDGNRSFSWVALGDEKDSWNGLLFASELEMLYSLVKRNNIPVNGSYFTPEPMNLFEFDLKDIPNYTKTKYEKEAGKSTVPFAITGKKGARATVTEITKTTDTRRVPKSTLSRREKAWAKVLKHETGLDFDSIQIFEPKSFELYKNQRELGAMHGTIRRTNLIVEVPSIKKEDYVVLKSRNKGVFVRVKNVRAGHGHRRVISAVIDEPYNEVVEDVAEVSMVKGPGGPITEERFLELTQHGCSYCSGNIDPSDADDVLWAGEGNNQPVCMRCAVEDALTRKHMLN